MLQKRDDNVVEVLTNKPMHVAWLKVFLSVSKSSQLVSSPMWLSHSKHHGHHCQHRSRDSVLLTPVREMLHWPAVGNLLLGHSYRAWQSPHRLTFQGPGLCMNDSIGEYSEGQKRRLDPSGAKAGAHLTLRYLAWTALWALLGQQREAGPSNGGQGMS